MIIKIPNIITDILQTLKPRTAHNGGIMDGLWHVQVFGAIGSVLLKLIISFKAILSLAKYHRISLN